MSCRFSIIIPVYNVEKYLPECFGSILSQKFTDFEIICIDDCSTDKSWDLLQENAAKDKRIRIFKQEKNAGQGVARNRALDLAIGEYILFVDPDDWIEKDALGILDAELKRTNAQVLFFQHYEDRSGKRTKVCSGISKYLKEKNFCSWKDMGKNALVFWGTCWDKCYNKNFIEKNKIRFSPTRIGEDNLFVQNSILSAEKLFACYEYLYYYRVRTNSSANSFSDENFCVFENIEQTEKLILCKGLEKELKKALEKYQITALRRAYQHISLNSRDLFKQEVKSKFSAKIYKKFLEKLNPSVFEKIFSVKNKPVNGIRCKVVSVLGLSFPLPNKK